MTHASYRWLSKLPGDGWKPGLTRRLFLASAAAPVLYGQKAELSSFDLSLLDQPATPNDLFFVRDHFPTPNVTSAGWTLAVGGAVAAPLEIPFDDLAARPRKALGVTLECAENPAGGGLVSHAEWSGVSLASILQAARPAAEAGAIRLDGADGFSRVVPLAKAMGPDSLLALTMNGEKLPVNHGFPLRAIIPGWYGMDSVKWLQRIVVLGPSDPVLDFQSSGMNRIYNRVMKVPSGEQKITRLTEIQVRSVVAWPPDNARLIAERYEVRGFAWTGSGLVAAVNFSNDGGRTWTPAQLESRARPFTWVRWKAPWRATAGEHVLMSRASDDAGRRQPLDRDPLRRDAYELNYCAPVRCLVR